MSKKTWNLMFVVGNPKMFANVTANADNPCTKQQALEGARVIDGNGGGWRVWVEHKDTGKRIFESSSEVKHRLEMEAFTALKKTIGL